MPTRLLAENDPCHEYIGRLHGLLLSIRTADRVCPSSAESHLPAGRHVALGRAAHSTRPEPNSTKNSRALDVLDVEGDLKVPTAAEVCRAQLVGRKPGFGPRTNTRYALRVNDVEKRRSYTPRRVRERRLYRLAVTGGVSGVIGVGGLVLAAVGVIGAAVPILALMVTAVCVFLGWRVVAG